jgi:hypothetical protein
MSALEYAVAFGSLAVAAFWATYWWRRLVR